MRVCPVCLRIDASPEGSRCAKDGTALLAIDPLDPSLDLGDGPALGTLFANRYVLVGVLGVGATGAVYRAVQRTLGREVALKVLSLPPELAGPRASAWNELRARFRREAELLAGLRSPHLVEVFDAGETADGTPWLAMERAPGEPLDRVLDAAPGGRLPVSQALAIGKQLAAALADVHARGVVHRDVKPANILVAMPSPGGPGGPGKLPPKLPLKLVDFGIARALADAAAGSVERLTATGIVLGSLAYMAPEQLSTRAGVAVGPATDVYAAGVTLYELVAGQHPYPGPSAPAYALQHREAPIPDLGRAGERSALGRGLAAVVARCLAKDPADRYPDGAALAAALEQASDPAVLATRAADVRARLAEDAAPAPRPRRLRAGRVLRWVAAALGVAVFVWGLVEGR